VSEISALVAAAGRGTRAGLPYPKTLFQLLGKPILVHIFKLLAPFDVHPTVIVSPDGKEPVRQCLEQNQLAAHLIVQSEARGMGDAVLHFTQSPASSSADHLLLIWGDIPFIQAETLESIISAHMIGGNDFTFATRQVNSAYTVVLRDGAGHVKRVFETREEGLGQPQPGERDIGLFIFRKELVLNILREELAGKWGKSTHEHGFLYVIGHLAERGFKVVALPVATELDLVSLNSMKDIDSYL
jgi:bifunctional UDP-N-acetylglucosamine pyrophosphorylase/glucosamine-1-phosphate N-acetyltransferase